jgi:hypothetical protein
VRRLPVASMASGATHTPSARSTATEKSRRWATRPRTRVVKTPDKPRGASKPYGGVAAMALRPALAAPLPLRIPPGRPNGRIAASLLPGWLISTPCGHRGRAADARAAHIAREGSLTRSTRCARAATQRQTRGQPHTKTMATELVRRSYSRRDKDAYESESDGELETEALFEEVAALEEKVQSLDGTRDKQELLRTVAELRDVRKRYNRALGQRKSRGRPATAQSVARKRAMRDSNRRPQSARPRSRSPKRDSRLRRSWSGTTTQPKPFYNLENDVQLRLKKKEREERKRREKEDELRRRDERAREILLSTAQGLKPRGFEGVDRHQQEQNKRRDEAYARRQAELESLNECAQFKAKPLPKSTHSFRKQEAEADLDRIARIQRDAERTAAKATDATTKPALNETAPARLETKKAWQQEEKKKISETPEEITARLDREHARWRKTLERCKKVGRSGTIPVDPLAKRREAHEERRRKHAEEKARRERAAAEDMEAQETLLREKRVRRLARATANRLETTRQTYSSYLKAQAIREKQQAQRDREKKERDEQFARDEKLRLAAKRLAKDLKITQGREAMDPAEAARSARRDFRRQLRKNKARLDKAREKAPSLVARLSLESARDKARAQALRKVAKAVYGTDKADWSRVPDAEAIFDAEDRAFLEIGAEADDDFEFE